MRLLLAAAAAAAGTAVAAAAAAQVEVEVEDFWGTLSVEAGETFFYLYVVAD